MTKFDLIGSKAAATYLGLLNVCTISGYIKNGYLHYGYHYIKVGFKSYHFSSEALELWKLTPPLKRKIKKFVS
jgi:hypothetical protein